MTLAGNSDKESYVKYLHLSINVGKKRKNNNRTNHYPQHLIPYVSLITCSVPDRYGMNIVLQVNNTVIVCSI